MPSSTVVGCCLAGAAVLTVAVSPPGALAEMAPPVVRLAEGGTGSSAASVGGETIYEVVRGDSLWRIAERVITERSGTEPSSRDIALFWPHIYAANRMIVGDNPCLIHPGQRLRIPEV